MHRNKRAKLPQFSIQAHGCSDWGRAEDTRKPIHDWTVMNYEYKGSCPATWNSQQRWQKIQTKGSAHIPSFHFQSIYLHSKSNLYLYFFFCSCIFWCKFISQSKDFFLYLYKHLWWEGLYLSMRKKQWFRCVCCLCASVYKKKSFSLVNCNKWLPVVTTIDIFLFYPIE